MRTPNNSGKEIERKLSWEDLPDLEDAAEKLEQDLRQQQIEEEKHTQEIIRKYKEKQAALQKVKNSILEFFLKQGYEKDDLSIDFIEDEKSGANLHFVLDINNEQVQKKLHIKSVSNQQSSFGTKYSEVLAYKILEEYGCGPKEMSTRIEFPDGFEKYQDVSSSGANLMVITEDLSNPDPENPNKSFNFRTKKEAQSKSHATGSDTEMQLYDTAPEAAEDNIQRCLITTLVKLLSLHDVTSNPGNIGLQYIKNEDGSMSIKPHIIDFKINGFFTDIQDITNSFWGDDTSSNLFTSTIVPFHESCFTFQPDDTIRLSTLERIFGEDGNKAMEVIDRAIHDIQGRFTQQLQRNEAVEFLDVYSASIKKKFDTFSTLCKETLETKQPSISPTPANTGVSLSQKDQAPDQHSSPYHV